MNSNFIEAIGSIAGILTTAAFLPQVIKVIQTRSTGDLSIGMFFMLVTGVALWLVYGLYISSMPIILANAVTLVLNLIILFYKMKFK